MPVHNVEIANCQWITFEISGTEALLEQLRRIFDPREEPTVPLRLVHPASRGMTPADGFTSSPTRLGSVAIPPDTEREELILDFPAKAV
jgi:hypothetical protein